MSFEWYDIILTKTTMHSEGCIVKRYIVEESILYCMEYGLDGNIKVIIRGRVKGSWTMIGECDKEPLDKGKNVYLTNIQNQQLRRWVL